jgi:hypothetical protein
MRHEYTLRTPDGDRPYVHGEGERRLVKDEVVTLPSGERFAVTRIVEERTR